MHQNLEKLTLNHKQKNENTNLPSWKKGIPNDLKLYILDFLSPTEALQCIITSKSSIEHFGSYLIQRLRHEKNTYTMIRVGYGFTLAMRNDGSIFAWGANFCGQLGLGHTNHQNTPQRINPSHFQGKSILSIQAGYGHTLARCADGTLFAWGWNNCGQLGLGHTNEPSTPQQIDPNHFQGRTLQSIQTGLFYTYALCTDGTLFSWGANDHGQLGLGNTTEYNTPQQINPSHFQGKSILSIQAGYGHTLARCADDTLFAWGWNNCGQLGLGHTNEQSAPQQIDPNHFQGKTIKSIHTFDSYNLVQCTDGFLFAWGANKKGQLGLGHNNNQNTPQLIDSTHFQGKTIQSLHTGSDFALTLCTDGSLFSWGRNNDGQLGLGHTNHQNTPQQIDPSHFLGKTIQSIHTLLDHTLVQCTDGILFSWGANKNGQLGLGHNNNQNTPQLIDSTHFQSKTIQSIHKESHTLVQCADGSLFAWGINNHGQLGLGHNYNGLTPKQVTEPIEQAFREGHQRLTQHHVFFNTPDPKSRLLSKCVLQPIETKSIENSINDNRHGKLTS